MRNARLVAVMLAAGFFSFASLPDCYGQTSAQQSQLAKVAAMFHRGSSEQELLRAWESFFRSNPKANVGWTLSFLRREVEKTRTEGVEQARRHVAAAAKSLDSVRNELAAARRRPGVGAQQDVKKLEATLQTVGEDAQLANVDLQDKLQEQQQALQMLSNINKQLNDTAMAVIRKVGG